MVGSGRLAVHNALKPVGTGYLKTPSPASGVAVPTSFPLVPSKYPLKVGFWPKFTE